MKHLLIAILIALFSGVGYGQEHGGNLIRKTIIHGNFILQKDSTYAYRESNGFILGDWGCCERVVRPVIKIDRILYINERISENSSSLNTVTISSKYYIEKDACYAKRQEYVMKKGEEFVYVGEWCFTITE